jgi:ABC-type dipeptide/oligopeptide/nickel transport system permease subunit
MFDSSIPAPSDSGMHEPGIRLVLEQKDRDPEMGRTHAPRRYINGSLLLGSIIVFLVILLALIGPSIAPRDPMEENVILQIDGKWLVPPFPLLTHGFPFGTDEFGRDLYSRVLWGIRPTLIMVTVVAIIRLLIGVLIGLTAGWTVGRPARFLDTMIELALAIPVLLVALCVIAIVGVELGIWAFIIGLAITGWVETAQQVREQTQIVRGQSYIEAARSLGALNRQILSRHVLKQITPMLVMLFAFEMSSTLMTTAGLGFLGYYIGGDVWIEVDDFVARRISGMPELGQMLATSWVTLTKPWVMVVVGTMIFVTIFGFNLLGEGLRQNLEVIRVGRRSLFGQFKEKASYWTDQHIWHPLAQILETPAFRLGATSSVVILVLVVVLGFSFLRWFEIIPAAQGSSSESSLAASVIRTIQSPGFSETENPATRSESAGGDETGFFNPEIIWEFMDDSGFSGGPVLSNNHYRLYAVSAGGSLYSLALSGNIIWQVELPAGGVGRPAIAQDDSIVVSDKKGGLTKVSSDGVPVWHFQTTGGNHSHSGPIIDTEGNIYYTVGTLAKGALQSVLPDGDDRWVSQARTLSFIRSPILNADEDLVFLKEDTFTSKNGELLSPNSSLRVLSFFSGKDGKDYLVSDNWIIQWIASGDTIEVVDIAEWDASDRHPGNAPTQVGVSAQGVGWLLYTSPGGNSDLIWVTLSDETLGKVKYPKSSAVIVDQKPENFIYMCGGESFDERTSECAAFSPESDTPLWKIDLGNSGRVEGGIYHDGILFVTTSQGKLIAISETGSGKTRASTPSPIPPTAKPVEIESASQQVYLPVVIFDNNTTNSAP